MDGYEAFEKAVVQKFAEVAAGSEHLFRTNADLQFDLFGTYLNSLPPENRQHYNCNACRHFIQRYGGLVTIGENGSISSALWDETTVPEFFKLAVREMRLAIERSKITGVFLSENKTLGTPVTGNWTHLHVELPRNLIFARPGRLPSQCEAEKQEEFKMLKIAHSAYSKDVVDKAVALIHSNTMYRGEQVRGVAEWFQTLVHTKNISPNLLWQAVASAPTGFCHIRSSMIGTLLDDIAQGLDMETVAARFAEKMNPNHYQRAQVAPTAGNIQRAEKIVQDLGIENSLHRRYATLNDIPEFIWKDRRVEKKSSTGVFANITPKAIAKPETAVLPSMVMTWEKFSRIVLPFAEEIEVLTDQPDAMMALVTATDSAAPNILQWDNPFSWYYANGGVDAEMKRRVEAAGGRFEGNLMRATLMWEGYTDLDLHCQGPDDHIYWSAKHGRYGFLDVDANGVDGLTTTPVENIRWAEYALPGQYEFFVHTFRTRDERSTPFKLSLRLGKDKEYTYSNTAGYTGWQETVYKVGYSRVPTNHCVARLGSGGHGQWSYVATWALTDKSYAKVTGIVNSPNYWGKNQHGQRHIFFLLDGCKDPEEGRGRGFFNEFLKPELREVRKTLEAYTASTLIEGGDEASACGMGFSIDRPWNLTVRVKGPQTTRIIKIDRWD